MSRVILQVSAQLVVSSITSRRDCVNVSLLRVARGIDVTDNKRVQPILRSGKKKKHLCGPTHLGVTAAVGGATTSGVRGSSSSVWEVQSMSLALLLPDTPVLGSTTASPASSPVAAGSSGGAVSASALALAGMSPGWDRAELRRRRGILVNKVRLHLFLLSKTAVSLVTCTWTPPVGD